MKIKINDKILCFPPYISTTWDNVKSLRIENEVDGQEIFVITLNDNFRVRIADIDVQIANTIFATHLRHLEQKTEAIPAHPMMGIAQGQFPGMPFRIGFGGLENLGSVLQHNPAQSNIPPLPKEIISKISGVAKVMSPEEMSLLPKPEPHCNCVHCQITRAMYQDESEPVHEAMLEEEIVTDEDLRFRLWDIDQTGDKLYNVKNPLDENEQYGVFLGDPIGCTCGQKNCEHIRAVLNS